MKKFFSLFAAVLFAGSMMAADVIAQKYTLASSDNGKSQKTGDVTWNIAANAIAESSSNTKLTGTITVVLPDNAILKSVEITKSNSWGSGATVTFASGTTSLNVFSNSGTFTLTSNETDGTYTFTKTGTSSKNAWVKDITVKYEEGEEPTKVANPKFSLAEGTYEGTQNVELSCKTEGATIYYTLDGTDPTTASAVYSAAIPVAATTTIKAFAAKAELDNSDVVSATYTILAGADVVLDFTDNTEWQFPLGTTKTTGTNSYTSGDYTVTVYGPSGNGYYYDNDAKNLLIGKSDAYMQLPVFKDKAIARIVTLGVTGGSTAVKFNVFEGENAVSTEVTDCTQDQTFDLSPKKKNVAYLIKVTSAANIRLGKIKIWFGEADPATAIDNTELEGKAIKAIENGQLVIIKNGVRYNALGNVIR